MRLTTQAIQNKKGKEKIVVLTAYDFPFARMIDQEGVDIILVGDSLGMVVLGHETTLPVTVDDMIHHAKAVSRAVKNSLLVVDMPYGSYDKPESAVQNAERILKETCGDAIKLEGGKEIEKQLKALQRAKIPTMGHIGMTPQSIEKLGGYRVQGKSSEEAQKIENDAKLLQDLGAFSLVLECVPTGLGEKVTQSVQIPTIGIGAGPGTDGQVLVLHDMLGISGNVAPRFVRKYAHLEDVTRKAVYNFRQDVLSGSYPSMKESY